MGRLPLRSIYVSYICRAYTDLAFFCSIYNDTWQAAILYWRSGLRQILVRVVVSSEESFQHKPALTMHTLNLWDGKVLLDHCIVSDATVNNVKSKKYWRIARESLKQFAHITLAPLVVRNVNYK